MRLKNHQNENARFWKRVLRVACCVLRWWLRCFQPGTRNPEPGTIFLIALFWLCAVPFCSAQPIARNGANGIERIPYDAPNEDQVKIEFSYSQVTNFEGRYLWKNALIKEFPLRVPGSVNQPPPQNRDDVAAAQRNEMPEPQMTAETPECISDQRLDEIDSTNSSTPIAAAFFSKASVFNFITPTWT